MVAHVLLTFGLAALQPPVLRRSREHRHSPALCKMAAVSAPPASAAALEEECSKPERSLGRIAELVETLAADPVVARPKKAVLGDWRLVFASNEEALAPFTSRCVSPPFGVVEDIFCRIDRGADMRIIEVERRVGPFGNAKRALQARYDIVAAGKGSANRLAFQVRWMDDPSGRETEPPSKEKVSAELIAAGSLIVLRDIASPASSCLVFSRLSPKQLARALDDLGVKKE
mmetsp:Transcript_43361/g.137121  ORF Transcript_43361/g.137121 Transcript_43361/m.137121 type:complete len:230 (-) Transcript_43361:67-756(-)